MKKVYSLLLAVLALFVLTSSLHAQQTVGDTTKPESYSVLKLVAQYQTGIYGGLRLPRMTTDQRTKITDTLTAATKAEAKGLTIYNTDINCVEYWNDSKWISLCSGSASITINDDHGNPVDPSKIPFPADKDSTQGPFTPHDKPECTGVNPPYTVVLVLGNDYSRLDIVDASTGAFKLTMLANPTLYSRMAIVRITNNCTGQSKDEIFTQGGSLPSNCVDEQVPNPTAASGNSLCGSGAVYMYINKPAVAGKNYIWTLNGVQVGTGNTYAATGAGTYIVYLNSIGCPKNGRITIAPPSGGAVAPEPVNQVWASNNGIQCSANDPITLRADRVLASGESIAWLRDGILQVAGSDYIANDPAGLSIIVRNPGVWTATVKNGSCYSNTTASSSVSVAVNTPAQGSAVAPYVIQVNGSTSVKFCAGGSHTLTVFPVDPAATYDWYVGAIKVGSGNGYIYNVPSGFTGSIDLSVIATKGTLCPVSQVSPTYTVNTSAPGVPTIATSTTEGVVCNGASMTLTATGGTTYEWTKDGQATGTSSAVLTVSEAGTYKVRAISGGCFSPYGMQTVKNASTNIITWVDYTPEAKLGINYTFSVQPDAGNPSAPSSYTWKRKGGVVIPGTGAIVHNINFNGSDTIYVTALNSCGSYTISMPVKFISDCVPPAFNTLRQSDSIIAVAVGSPIVLNYGSILGDLPSYQWKKNGSTVGTDAVYAKTAALSDAGTYSLYLTPAAGCAQTQVKSPFDFIVQVLDPSSYTTDATLSMDGKVCFDTKETENINNNGFFVNRTETSSPLPQGSWNYVVSNTGGKTIESIIWQVDNMSFYSGTATSALPNKTFTVTYKDLQTIRNMVQNSVKATPGQTITITAYVKYAGGGGTGKISKVVKIQDFICCDGYVCVGCAFDYSSTAISGAASPNPAGDWAKNITTVNDIYNNTQTNKGVNNIVDLNLSSSYTANPVGNLCVYKKDVSNVFSYAAALAACGSGNGADGRANVWYAPSISEYVAIFSALGGRGTDANFGAPGNDGKAFTSTYYYSNSESAYNAVYIITGGRNTFLAYKTSKNQPTGYPVRCVTRM